MSDDGPDGHEHTRRVRGLLALVLLVAACAEPVAPPAPEATATPTSNPTPEAAPSPTRANVVPDAGVLYVFGADALLRYDGSTGELARIAEGGNGLVSEASAGAYVIGRHGGVTLRRWDGLSVAIECGVHYVAVVTSSGACAALRAGPDGGAYVRLDG